MIDYTLPLDQLPDPLPIEPLTKPFDVTITPPGSKSITCRAYVLAALAEGESKIIRPLRADDTDHLLNALCTLGAEARWVPGEDHEGEDVYIKGVAGRFPRGGNLYMGEGGTPTRFMIACACLAKEPVTIDASPRMRERPIAEGVDMLRQLGARIDYVEAEGRLPVRVTPSEKFVGGEIEVGQTQSSQFISALMLISSFLDQPTRLRLQASTTSEAYVDLTGQVLTDWGATVSREVYQRDDALIIHHMGKPILCVPRQLSSHTYEIESDVSSAIYWAIAAALVSKACVYLNGVSYRSIQPDTEIIEVLGIEGARHGQDRQGRMFIRGRGTLSQMSAGASGFPDGAMAMAAAAASAEQTSRITGLRTLRVKETDRIAALANELRKVGCTVETGEDWISITPPEATSNTPHAGSDQREDPDRIAARPGPSGSSRWSDPASTTHNPIIIETYNDHRMAMAFAVLGLNPPLGRPLAIRNPKCVAKSYPGFWKDFAKLYT